MKKLHFNSIVGRLLALTGIFLLLGQNAHAGFVVPTYFGQPHSTSSTWDYNGNWAVGDSASHLVGPFSAVGGVYPLDTTDHGCGAGVPCLNNNNLSPSQDVLTFSVPNFVDDLSLKLLRVQFEFVRSAINPATGRPFIDDPVVTDVSGFKSALPVPGQLQMSSYLTETVMTNGVFHTFGLFDFTIRPNPDYERFTISGVAGTELRRVRIDSISIPEPATLLLVGIALLGMGIRRHRA